MKAIGYIRVSTEEQATSGLGLEAQRTQIASECRSRGWELIGIESDEGVSAKTVNGRPGLSRAFARIESGAAECLVVAKLDRLSRSLVDFAVTFEQARAQGWKIVPLDLGQIDPSTPSGEMMASVMASFAQYERRLISERTKAALAALKAKGVPLGRPKNVPQPVIDRIRAMRDAGHTYKKIAESLNYDRVPTAQGGKAWYAATVRKVGLSAG